MDLDCTKTPGSLSESLEIFKNLAQFLERNQAPTLEA
jgi:hypothetical protein